MPTKAYAAQSADKPARPVHADPPRAAADRRRDRDPVLRRLPLRPAPGPQRVERVSPHRLPVRARPRDRRPGDEGRQRASRSSRRATSPPSAAWSIRAAPARAASEGLEQYCQHGIDAHLQLPGQALRRRHLRRVLRQRSSWTRRSCCTFRTSSTWPATAPLLCAGITTYSPLRHWKVGPGQEGRHRRARRARAHGGEVRPRVRAPTSSLFTTSPGKAEDAQAARRRRGGRLEGRRRDGEARRQLRLHPRRGVGRRTT